MKKILFAVFLLFYSGLLHAQSPVLPDQQNKPDSMAVLLKQARHDTTRATIYIGLCEILYFSNPDAVLPVTKNTGIAKVFNEAKP